MDRYRVPAEFVPSKRHVVRDGERAILVEDGQLAAASGASGEPDHDGILLLPPRFEQEVEHPASNAPIHPTNKHSTQNFQKKKKERARTLYYFTTNLGFEIRNLPRVVRVGEAVVAGVVAEVADPLGEPGQRDPPLKQLAGRHAGDIPGAGWPGLLGQQVERADEPLGLRRGELGVAGQPEPLRAGGGGEDDDEEDEGDARGRHWRSLEIRRGFPSEFIAFAVLVFETDWFISFSFFLKKKRTLLPMQSKHSRIPFLSFFFFCFWFLFAFSSSNTNLSSCGI